jgi:succinyl-diaminopimelate desuccinylase
MHHYHEDKITGFKGKNLVGRIKGNKEGVKVLLNAHLDTVNICKGWNRDPLKAIIEDENKLYGLGALDMKSGAAAMMIALDAFVKLHPEFNGEILYSFVSVEEGPFGLGTQALIYDELCSDADVALIPEPSSGFSKNEFPCLCLGARGGINYTVRFSGKAAHAANPEEGVSAILDASKVMVELKQSKTIKDDKLGKGSICIIESKGGGQACSVADDASFTIFRHVVRGEDEDYLKNEIQKAIQKASIKCDTEIQFREGPFNGSGGFEPYTVEEDHPYTLLLNKCIKEVTGKSAKIAYFSSIGDFNTVASRLQVPTFVFGPGGENYHTHDEFVYIDSVIKTSEIIYEYLKELLLK